jgi:hypothetical protein
MALAWLMMFMQNLTRTNQTLFLEIKIQQLKCLYKDQLELGKKLHELRGERIKLKHLENQLKLIATAE